MPTETFYQFNTKALPLSGDYLVGFDSTAEIKITLASIAQVVASLIPTIPTGTIITHAAQTAPAGFFPCDGRLLSVAAYSNLYNVIGKTYGSSPGYFNLPDLRGYFVRGWDNGAGVDIIDGTYTQSGRTVTITTNTPHGLTTGSVVTVQFTTGAGVNGTFNISVIDSIHFSYTATASQTTSGNVILPGLSRPFGQLESDGIGVHTHTVNDPGHIHTYDHWVGTFGGGPGINGYLMGDQGNINTTSATTNITINSSGTANDTRPKNIALLYCIKY